MLPLWATLNAFIPNSGPRHIACAPLSGFNVTFAIFASLFCAVASSVSWWLTRPGTLSMFLVLHHIYFILGFSFISRSFVKPPLPTSTSLPQLIEAWHYRTGPWPTMRCRIYPSVSCKMTAICSSGLLVLCRPSFSLSLLPSNYSNHLHRPYNGAWPWLVHKMGLYADWWTNLGEN